MIHPICLPFFYFRFFLAEIQNVSGSMNAESIIGCIIRHTYNLPTWGKTSGLLLLENILKMFVIQYQSMERISFRSLLWGYLY